MKKYLILSFIIVFGGLFFCSPDYFVDGKTEVTIAVKGIRNNNIIIAKHGSLISRLSWGKLSNIKDKNTEYNFEELCAIKDALFVSNNIVKITANWSETSYDFLGLWMKRIQDENCILYIKLNDNSVYLGKIKYHDLRKSQNVDISINEMLKMEDSNQTQNKILQQTATNE